MMITITPNDNPVTDGNLKGYFTGKKLYTTSSSRPASHQLDVRTIRGGEAIVEMAGLKYGNKARQYGRFTTARFPMDKSYYVDDDPANGLSRHSTFQAIDMNWQDKTFEREWVLIVAYDTWKQGPITQKLNSLGVNGVGTYYLYYGSTFIHIDSREKFTPFMLNGLLKKRRYIMDGKAKRLHEEYMAMPSVQNYFGLAPTPPVVVNPPIPEPSPTPSPTPNPSPVPAPTPSPAPGTSVQTTYSKIGEQISDMRAYMDGLILTQDNPGEDYINPQYRYIAIALLAIALLAVGWLVWQLATLPNWKDIKNYK